MPSFTPTSPYLKPLPDPWAMRGLATLLIALFVSALVLASVVHLPETVTSHFVLRPVHGANPVRTPQSGMISRVEVVEGEPVTKGSLLFELRSEAIGARSSELRGLQAESQGAKESLELGREKFESTRRAEADELRRLEDRIGSAKLMLELQRREAALTVDVMVRYQKLDDLGLLSRTERIRYERQANEAELAVRLGEKELSEAEAALERRRHEHKANETERREAERELLEQIEQAEIRVAPLLEDLAQRAGSRLSILAPCSGSVLRLQVQAPGTFVQPGEVVGEVACEGDALRAHLSLPKTDLALLEPGQEVKLLFDAFPYQRHGVRYATLRWISPASVEKGDQHSFRALADVADKTIVVGGKPRALKAGMGGVAKIVVGRRRVIAYAFEPLRQLRESMRGGTRE
jgi:membrane fusion protein